MPETAAPGPGGAWLTDQAQAVHALPKGTYGSSGVHAELTLGHGIGVGCHAVELLMRRADIKGLPGSRRPRPRREVPTAADLVDRRFICPSRDQLWVADITEHPPVKAGSTAPSS